MKLKIPPPLLFAIVFLLIYLFPEGNPYKWQGFLPYPFLIIGSVISFAGVYELHKKETTVSPIHLEKSVKLVTTGIYRFTRNPMYLGLVFFLIAGAIWLNRPLSFLVIIGFMLYLNIFQIQAEEKILEEKFGSQYFQYLKNVRHWL